MDPNWSFSTQEIYRKFEARTDEMIKRSLAKAKDEMVKIIKDTYRRENADKTLSDEEVEDKTKPQIDEACQAIARLGELRGIDTSSIVVEVGSDDHDDEANEGDIENLTSGSPLPSPVFPTPSLHFPSHQSPANLGKNDFDKSVVSAN